MLTQTVRHHTIKKEMQTKQRGLTELLEGYCTIDWAMIYTWKGSTLRFGILIHFPQLPSLDSNNRTLPSVYFLNA